MDTHNQDQAFNFSSDPKTFKLQWNACLAGRDKYEMIEDTKQRIRTVLNNWDYSRPASGEHTQKSRVPNLLARLAAIFRR
jgi:hypothetical protein